MAERTIPARLFLAFADMKSDAFETLTFGECKRRDVAPLKEGNGAVGFRTYGVDEYFELWSSVSEAKESDLTDPKLRIVAYIDIDVGPSVRVEIPIAYLIGKDSLVEVIPKILMRANELAQQGV